jgi:glycosyltransferase involved in cell wall biosynthesis
MLSKSPLGRSLSRRCFEHYLEEVTQLRPGRELGRHISSKLHLSTLINHKLSPISVDAIYKDLDRFSASLLNPKYHKAIYAYEDGALKSFKRAGEMGIVKIYDLPIGYWRSAREIQLEEAERRPDWAETMPILQDSPEKLERKDQELQCADAIVVASRFTAKTLEKSPFSLPKPMIIPYGCPEPLSTLHSPNKNNKLQVLFVGSLSQRKGLADLLQAADGLKNDIELTIVGRRVAPCASLDRALTQHRWYPSLNHEKILELMRQNDVLVFPSLFEGFGLVITEAISQGLPVIATDHTCAPDIISHEQEGFIVPIRSPQSIQERLLQLINDRALLRFMSENALKKAQNSNWETYRQELSTWVKNTLKDAL